MKIISEAHLHTTFCDGKNTATEMAEKAISLGYTGLGYSAHSPAPFDKSCPGIYNKENAYRTEIHRLKEVYDGRLDILCGVEQDFDGPIDREKYDYIVGSVHYLEDVDGNHVQLDNITEHLQYLLKTTFTKDPTALYKVYYEKVVENVRKYKPEIVGHYDLIVKKNDNSVLFDETSEEYRKFALEALDTVIDETLSYGGMIEINTGGIARGARTTPYPSKELLFHMAKRGANIMLNSDSHSVNTLGFGLYDALDLAMETGFKSIWMIKNGKFQEFIIE